MTLNLIIGCSVASGRSLALLSLLSGYHPCFLCTLLLLAEVVVLLSDTGGTRPLLGCLHAQLVLRLRLHAECF